METPIMTKSEVAKYLRVDERTVDNWTKDGILTRCKTPKPLYNRQQIEKLANVELTPYSPLERRKMNRLLEEKDNKIKELQKKVDELLSILIKTNLLTSEAIYNANN
jgi:hypothetical protein